MVLLKSMLNKTNILDLNEQSPPQKESPSLAVKKWCELGKGSSLGAEQVRGTRFKPLTSRSFSLSVSAADDQVPQLWYFTHFATGFTQTLSNLISAASYLCTQHWDSNEHHLGLFKIKSLHEIKFEQYFVMMSVFKSWRGNAMAKRMCKILLHLVDVKWLKCSSNNLRMNLCKIQFFILEKQLMSNLKPWSQK